MSGWTSNFRLDEKDTLTRLKFQVLRLNRKSYYFPSLWTTIRREGKNSQHITIIASVLVSDVKKISLVDLFAIEGMINLIQTIKDYQCESVKTRLQLCLKSILWGGLSMWRLPAV